METVKLDISIDIHQSGIVDTEITVEAWNAMTPAGRDAIKDECWQSMIVDNGGIVVITPDAIGD